MKKYFIFISVSIFAIAFNTNVFTQNHFLHDYNVNDSITAIDLPQNIMLNGQTDDLPVINNNSFTAINMPQNIMLCGQTDDLPIHKNDFQPPIVSVQESNYCNARITPSVTSDLIFIQVAEIGSTVDIYDLSGKSVLKRIVSNNYFAVNVSEFPKGIYIIVINGKQQKQSEKIVIR